MKINIKQRFKNKTFVVSLITLVLATIYQILGMFDVVPKVSEDTLTGILMLVVNFLSALGILVDPTTEGLSDSKRALTYGTEDDVRKNEETGGYAAGMLFSGRNRVTQPYTYNVNTKKGHGGIDIVGDNDKTVHAVEGGTVSMVSVWDGKTKTGTQSYGNLVVITDSTGKRHFYAHLASISMRKGQRVSAGDVVGIMGNTGNSFGAHTHYEVRTGQGTVTRINPAEFCGVQNAKGTYVNNVSAASPAPSHRGTAYTMTCKMLYVRKGPSVRYRRVGQFSRGEIFYVVARQGNWCQLESGNWMCAGKYLKRV